MKKIFIIALAVTIVTGCKKDLLDTSPYDSLASGNMWSSENLTDLGVTGVYATLNDTKLTVAGKELYVMDQYSFSSQHRNAQNFLTGTITPSDGLFSNNWQGLYEGIQRANDAILNIPKSPTPDVKKARYLAECKFLRAYFYSRLAQLWKSVPIYLEPFSDTEAIKGRSSEAEVWAQIIKDLTECINEPNLPQKYAKGDANFGHVTKGAAYALRGKAYLYTSQNSLAVADFNKVKDAGYSLFNNYLNLFKQVNEQCDEMIFSVQNLNITGYGSESQLRLGTRSSFGSGFNTYLISPNLVELYENVDGSPFNWDAILPGYSTMSLAKREVFFLRNNLTTAEINAARNRGAEMTLYLPTGNEQRVIRAYTNRDPRLAANVITPYSTYNGVFGAVNVTLTSRFPYRSDNVPSQDIRTNNPPTFYYLHRKFVYEGNSEIVDRSASPTDMPVIRYADVLLMWAEAINEQGFTQEAVSLVNQVRSRAGVAILQSVNPSLPTYVNNQTVMKEKIRDERRREFPTEGISFFDEMRWKSLKEKVFYPGNGAKDIWGVNQWSYTYLGDQLYTWPIPQVEIERNPKLGPNPGWSN
ncbi:carbohydrate-binding protein SusD [Pedobacter psychrophilus]|uniref:Carbohydrate-binding protein SusD n=1 Tax=Pedobacter psychrophilus TaxID=1826909 RepID=A0A179DGW6_9SPHI|nr:RagB/SusD family nutrient uptake outer membrane protein [Pedobacter psychrophilus]OAQ40317.1 carbohydrate-binding protein SusD [Pedobacter psychrophilus]